MGNDELQPVAAAGSAHFERAAPSEDAEVYARGPKRSLDLLVSIAALVAFAPLLVLVAIAIKLDTPGPVIFLQTRIGIERRRRPGTGPAVPERRRIIQPGRPFRILKLRTMTRDAEAGGPQWATPHDCRVTRVGRVLRRCRLDEFPQFVNVLRGEMSVFGPRPERLCFIPELGSAVPHYRERLVVLPGITGLAQVVNGYDTDLESVRRKIALDRLHIRDLCLWNDLVIQLRTVTVLVAGKGAR